VCTHSFRSINSRRSTVVYCGSYSDGGSLQNQRKKDNGHGNFKKNIQSIDCGQRRPSQTQKNEILSKIHARGKEEVGWSAPSLQHIQPGIVPTFFPPTQ
jgi:hypothetical protein